MEGGRRVLRDEDVSDATCRMQRRSASAWMGCDMQSWGLARMAVRSGPVGWVTNDMVAWKKGSSSAVPHEAGWLASPSTCPDASLVDRFLHKWRPWPWARLATKEVRSSKDLKSQSSTCSAVTRQSTTWFRGKRVDVVRLIGYDGQLRSILLNTSGSHN